MSSQVLYRTARLSFPLIVIGLLLGLVTGYVVNDGDVVKAMAFPPVFFAAVSLLLPFICFLKARQIDRENAAHGEKQ